MNLTNRRHRRLVITLAIAGVVSVATLATCGGFLWWVMDPARNWSKGKIQQSQQIGDEIIAQIEQYQRDHGEFPDSLDRLVPAYMDAVPRPTAGIREWEYHRLIDDGVTSFQLAFPSNRSGYPICFYEHGRSWYVDN